MELGLSKKTIRHFITVMDTVKYCEETMETIVPDSLPDAVRVLETQGVVMIRDKELSDGRATVSGVVELTAVYAPEGEGTAKKITQTIPFKASCDGGDVDTECELVAQAQLVNGEMRLLNPRKMLGRVNVAVAFAVYAPRETEITESVESTQNLETLMTSVKLAPVISVSERTVSLSDDLELGGGKGAAEEILASRVSIVPGECKFVGAKGVVKGNVGLDVLYLTAEDGSAASAYFELPFTQIIELDREPVDAMAQVEFSLTGYSVELNENSAGRGIAAAFYITAQTVVSEQREVTVLEDLYSTAADTDVSRVSREVTSGKSCGQVRRSIRETIETDTAAISVASVKADVNSVGVDATASPAVLSGKLTALVLYVDENNMLKGVEEQFTIEAEAPLEEGQSICSVKAYVEPGAYALPMAGGVELRLELVFDYCVCSCGSVTMVESAKVLDERTGDMPSVVLRSVHGERLWDVAKEYRACPDAIAAINAVQGDTLPDDGRLLLIPRKRA